MVKKTKKKAENKKIKLGNIVLTQKQIDEKVQ